VAKKKYTFNLSRTVTQTAEVVIKAESMEEAEELFDAQREETNDFEDAEWGNDEPDGAVDWEVDGPPD
jgi:hypothetical protein